MHLDPGGDSFCQGIEGFSRCGKIKKLGEGYIRLSARRPQIAVCAVLKGLSGLRSRAYVGSDLPSVGKSTSSWSRCRQSRLCSVIVNMDSMSYCSRTEALMRRVYTISLLLMQVLWQCFDMHSGIHGTSTSRYSSCCPRYHIPAKKQLVYSQRSSVADKVAQERTAFVSSKRSHSSACRRKPSAAPITVNGQ